MAEPEVKTSPVPFAWVASLHLHPERAGGITKGGPMTDHKTLTLVADKGIVGNTRYFGRLTKAGKPSPRQISLIDRSLLMEHEMWIGEPECLPPGRVRSNIEITHHDPTKETLTTPNKVMDLLDHLGKKIKIGKTAVIEITLAREPCWQMDVIAQGLQRLMGGHKQGVMARVVVGGEISTGDPLVVMD